MIEVNHAHEGDHHMLQAWIIIKAILTFFGVAFVFIDIKVLK